MKKLILGCIFLCLPCWIDAANSKSAASTRFSRLYNKTVLLTNRAATLEGIVEGLSNLPELPGLIFEYLETIEGDEEAKGAEIAELITEQLINMLSPNKAKLLGQLSKSNLGVAAVKVAKSLKGFIKKKGLPTTGKVRFIPREVDIKNGLILSKDGGYVDKFGNIWKEDKGKSI